MTSDSTDVFVSYAFKDKKIIDKLIEKNNSDDVNYWIAQRDQMATDKWRKRIREEIENNYIFLFILTPESNKSPECLKELNWAVKCKKDIFTVKIGDFEINGDIEYVISDIHRIEKNDDKLDDIIDKLKILMEKKMDSIFSRQEKELMQGFDDNMRKSLLAVKGTVIEIFKNSTVVDNYIDHGIKHSNNIINIIYDIVSIKNINELSVDERYVLLASAYLHDIGMQCDISERKDILKMAFDKANEMHGKFKIKNFSRKKGCKYCLEDQDQIRKNHHFITAAWIERDLELENSHLGQAFSGIDPTLIKEIIQVCLYHSKVNIMECRENFDTGNDRRLLIAALVRFADKIDVNKNRILTVNKDNLRMNYKFFLWLYENMHVSKQRQDNKSYNVQINFSLKDEKIYNERIKDILTKILITETRDLSVILSNRGYPVIVALNNNPTFTTNAIPGEMINYLEDNVKTNKTILQESIDQYNLENISKLYNMYILNETEKINILVIGDVMLDHILEVKHPEKGQVYCHDIPRDDCWILKTGQHETKALGGAAGIANALSSIPNVTSHLIGIIGDDMEGFQIKKLSGNGIVTEFIEIPGIMTTTKNYYKCHKSTQEETENEEMHRMRFDREDSSTTIDMLKDKNNFGKIVEVLKKYRNVDCVIIKDHEKGFIDERLINSIIEYYGEKIIIIDPKYKWDIYRNKKLKIKAVLPNILEAIYGIKNDWGMNDNTVYDEIKKRKNNNRLEESDYKLLRKKLPNSENFIVKYGKDGSVILDKNGSTTPIPPHKIGSYVSGIGSGNVFAAFFAVGVTLGNRIPDTFTIKDAVILATIAAGYKSSKEISDVVKKDELKEQFDRIFAYMLEENVCFSDI